MHRNAMPNDHLGCPNLQGIQGIPRRDRAPSVVQDRPARIPNSTIWFPDASFPSIGSQSGVTSEIVILGRPISRNGPITCVCRILIFYSRKITRVCISSIASESIAVSNMAGYCLRIRAAVIELYFGEFIHDCVGSTEGLPLVSPFKEAEGNLTKHPMGNGVPTWGNPTTSKRTLFQFREEEGIYISSYGPSCVDTALV